MITPSLLALGAFVAAASAAAATTSSRPAWPPEHMKHLPADYLQRVHATLSAGADRIAALDLAKARTEDSITWARFGIDALLLGRDVEKVNGFFESDKFAWGENPKFGFSLFATEYQRLYALFNHRTGLIKGRLSARAAENIEREMWRIARANSKLAEARRGVWDMEGSENHHITSKSGDLFAAQFLRNIPAYAQRKLDDGSTLAEQYEARRQQFLAWYDERAKRGQWVEAASPSYQPWSLLGLFNIRDFAEDPVLRRKADMYLDLAYANIAEETLLTTRGGPKSRVKVGHEYDAGMSDGSYNLLFGAPGRTFKPHLDKVPRSSGYYPPPAVVSLARDTSARGTYSFFKRWPGPVAAGGGKRSPGENDRLWRTLDPDRSVNRHGFATPNYVIGSAAVDPAWTDDAGMGFRWQGVVFAGDLWARIGFEVQPKNARGWHGFNPFFSTQDRNVLVTQKWAPSPPNPPGSHPAFLRIYFSPTLDELHESDDWIFVREGNAFAAVKVVTGGYAWTKPWKHSDAIAATQKDYLTPADGGAFIVLKSDVSPVITIANDAADYHSDFSAFQSTMKAQPIQWQDGVLRFDRITFHGPARRSEVAGKPVNLAPPRVNDSPFIRSEWNSGLVYIRKGSETVVLDFRDPSHPVKTIGGPVTAAFPAGVGRDQPVILGRK